MRPDKESGDWRPKEQSVFVRESQGFQIKVKGGTGEKMMSEGPQGKKMSSETSVGVLRCRPKGEAGQPESSGGRYQ